MNATEQQIAALRDIAADPALPHEASAYVERMIARGLTREQAETLYQQLLARRNRPREAAQPEQGALFDAPTPRAPNALAQGR